MGANGERGPRRRSFAPGRINLIGDHTDTTGGLVLPMAVQLGTSVDLVAGGDVVRLVSGAEPDPAVVPLDVADPAGVTPAWAAYVAGVVAEIAPRRGGEGRVTSTLPIGAGLSSSASLEVAVALALGATGSPLDLARRCQRAEQRASGVPCGIMDQLASVAGVAGHALLIDCASLDVEPVAIPDGVEVRAVHSGQARRLAGSAYAARRASCEQAETVVGPLRTATAEDLVAIDDVEVRRRARHVVTENLRVRAFAEALGRRDLALVGELMAASHRSLRDDFEVSTGALDALVDRLGRHGGVHGVRLTGAGFGGCVVVLCEPGALDEGWRLEASDGATVDVVEA
jgi:galactokinase